MLRGSWILCLVSVCWLVPISNAPAVVLYDGASQVTPNQSPWLWGYQALNKTNPFTPNQVTQTATGGATTLDSTAVSDDVAGYTTHLPNLFSPGFSHALPNLPTLDRQAGFSVHFTARLDSEAHSSGHRAGFSVIALSSDPVPQGVELAFWTDAIWAQNVGFTKGESTGLFATNAGLVDYELQVQGGSYALWADNVQVLSGALRDYSTFNGGPPLNPGFPYNQSNFLFFGDNTSSARASVTLAQIAVTQASVVPEPASRALLAGTLAGAVALAGGRRFRLRRRGFVS